MTPASCVTFCVSHMHVHDALVTGTRREETVAVNEVKETLNPKV